MILCPYPTELFKSISIINKKIADDKLYALIKRIDGSRCSGRDISPIEPFTHETEQR